MTAAELCPTALPPAEHPCTVGWGLVAVPSPPTTCPLHLLRLSHLPQPLGRQGGVGLVPRPASSSQGPPGSSWPHKDTLPSPPGEAVSPLARLLFCFKGFSSVEVNTVSIKSAIYKALCTHKVFTLPPSSPQQTVRKQDVLRMGPGSDSTQREGPGPGAIGPSAEGQISS